MIPDVDSDQFLWNPGIRIRVRPDHRSTRDDNLFSYLYMIYYNRNIYLIFVMNLQFEQYFYLNILLLMSNASMDDGRRRIC